jgi:hypothetical protein
MTNLPTIQTNVAERAQQQGVSEVQMWDEITEVLRGSGITQPMHRTLDRPVGGSYGANAFIDYKANEGIAIIVRENIANWGARRHDRLISLIGGMSSRALGNVEHVIYAGGGRVYGERELWRPDLRAFQAKMRQQKKSPVITESIAARKIHAPITRDFLASLGLRDRVKVSAVAVDNPKATGNEVIGAAAEKHGAHLGGMVIVEVGNAPAGYTQLQGAMVLANELALDPTDQYLAVTDGVELVQKERFSQLNLEAASKVQNVATALNSLNGWLKAVSDVNAYMSARS